MVNYREILRLDSLGYTQHQVAANIHSLRNTIREVIQRAHKTGIQWPLDDSVTNNDILAILYPERISAVNRRKEPDYSYIHKELAEYSADIVQRVR